jgi:hypothetical protein
VEPIRTSFSFSNAHQGLYDPHLFIEPCGHIPSPGEFTTAPFYPDRSQRMLAVYFDLATCYAINTELLLKLARERGGQHVGWDEWGARTIEVRGGGINFTRPMWVSGCRLFYTVSGAAHDNGPTYLQVHDFSHVGCGKHLRTPHGTSEGERARWFLLNLDGYKLPWNLDDSWNMDLTTGHDSLVFRTVSIPIFPFTVKRSLFFHHSVQGQNPWRPSLLYIWSL